MENMIKINLNKIEDVMKFYTLVNTFTSDIDVVSGSTVIDAKSLLGLYSLGLSKDISVRIISDNADEKKRFDATMEEFR